VGGRLGGGGNGGSSLQPPLLLLWLALLLAVMSTGVVAARRKKEGGLKPVSVADALEAERRDIELERQEREMHSADRDVVRGSGQFEFFIDPYEDCRPEAALDKCMYVRTVHECHEDDRFVSYLDVLYCQKEPFFLKASVIVIWMGILFYTLGIVAERFLCPALRFMSKRMRLPPDIAGITLLAFANGAPDLFTELAALSSGQKVDMGLALSVTLGSGMCICVAIFAVLVLLKPFKMSARVRPAYIRDSTAYLICCGLMLVFMRDGLFTMSESLCLVLAYVLYISYAIFTMKADDRPPEQGGSKEGREAAAGALQALSQAPGALPDSAHKWQPEHWADEYFSWSELGQWETACTPVSIPINLLLNLTMPVVQGGVVSERYAVVLCTVAPAFTTFALGVTPEAYGVYPCTLVWLGISIVLMLVLQLQVPHINRNPLRQTWLFAAIVFVQCIIWMNLLADELVALFHALGHALGVSQALIGGTVLAWGESLADLVASLAIARSGQSEMALAACFGCPVLNLAGGMGAGLVYQNVVVGPVNAKIDGGLFLLAIATMVVVTYQIAAVPVIHRWNLSSNLAWILLVLYGVSQLAFIMVESGILPDFRR